MSKARWKSYEAVCNALWACALSKPMVVSCCKCPSDSSFDKNDCAAPDGRSKLGFEALGDESKFVFIGNGDCCEDENEGMWNGLASFWPRRLGIDEMNGLRNCLGEKEERKWKSSFKKVSTRKEYSMSRVVPFWATQREQWPSLVRRAHCRYRWDSAWRSFDQHKKAITLHCIRAECFLVVQDFPSIQQFE